MTTVVIPAGAPIHDAAAWVGESCWLELHLHDLVTSLLAAGTEAERSSTLWTVRAHRAELAETWHRRLPELREFPRETYVRAPGDLALADAAAGVDLDDVIDALDALKARYLAHLDVAVGPADGPVADTLLAALARTADDRLSLS